MRKFDVTGLPRTLASLRPGQLFVFGDVQVLVDQPLFVKQDTIMITRDCTYICSLDTGKSEGVDRNRQVTLVVEIDRPISAEENAFRSESQR